MSNQAIDEYLQAILPRYLVASKKEKTKILDEFCANSKYDRKYAIARLSLAAKSPLPKAPKKSKCKYPKEILLPHIRFLWFRMGQLSARRMKKAFDVWLPAYKQNDITPQIKAWLMEMSASTLDRILKNLRSGLSQTKGLSATSPARFMQNVIPLHNHDATIDRPGHTQADTVAHCGTTLLGEFAFSLTVTDIDSTWTEARALHSKQAKQVVKAFKEIEDFLPFPVLSLNTDNGSEFLNRALANFCYSHAGRTIEFTRSRPYKKNDNCYVEQKNYTHVREVFGYERIETPELVGLMNEIYINYWLPLHNFFIPTFKLKEKVRIGARIKKVYGPPQTPYERLLQSKHLSDYRKQKLEYRFKELDPFVLSEGLQKKVHEFNSKVKQAKLGVKHATTIPAPVFLG